MLQSENGFIGLGPTPTDQVDKDVVNAVAAPVTILPGGACFDSAMSFAHTSIVTIRYMLLSVKTRENQDSKAHGGMFYEFCDEINSIEFRDAFLLIVNLFMSTIRENFFLSKKMIDKILTDFMNKLPGFMKRQLGLAPA